MMQAPIFRLLNTPEISALVGKEPTRIYPFGSAPQGTPAPYITHQTIAVTPYNSLSDSPKSDRHRVQIDVYAANPEQVVALALSVRKALEKSFVWYQVVFQEQEPTTKLYRYCFDAELILNR